MPIRGLATLVQTLALPAGDRLVEEPLLGAAVVQIVVDDLVAERAAGERAFLQGADRVAQGRGGPRGIGLVAVPLERGRQLELVFETCEPGGEQRREGEVGIDVAARDPGLDPLRA